MLLWKENKIFKEKFLVIGDWKFDNLNNFSKCDFISADTETKLYLNDKLLTEEDAYNLYKLFKAKWCREHIKVVAYAYMLSDGKNFALFKNIEDFLLCCATMLVKKVFWYNTKFDFSLFDYFFETNGWKNSDDIVKEFNGSRHKIPKNVYQSLNGDFGQRYQMRLWVEYTNKSYHKKVHNFKMLDICNIFPGGLRKNLEDWEIVDNTGKEVRKLHMDYVNADIEKDIDYLVADTKGLHLLAEKINDKIKEISGFSLFNGDYITAGGLAKKSLLQFMFKKGKPKENMKMFRNFFPMTAESDKKFRDLKLYQGGKCFVSPFKVNKILKKVYKFDINSMYPSRMKSMRYPVGYAKLVKEFSKDETKLYVVKIKNVVGVMKENAVPVWYDNLTNEYVERIFEQEEQYFWLEELKELENYYYLSYDIEQILEYDGYYCKGIQEYVEHYYKIKSNSKGCIKTGAKLFLNSAYGKLAQRIETVKCDYKMSEGGYIHLVKSETEIDEKNMMSVLVGSRITALARVLLMEFIRKICKGNPKKYFVYCDTDSVHSLCDYEDTDDKELGKMKNEGVYDYAKYIAPKTYIMYNDSVEDLEEKFEVHTKGVNTNVVKREIIEEYTKTKNVIEIFNNYFTSGITYKCLTSLNCVGGKALIYIDKMLLNPIREKDTIEDDERID